MIFSWMFYSLVIGLLLTGAAFLAERAAISLRLPRRHLWLSAMLITVLWPVVVLLWQSGRESATSVAPTAVPFAGLVENISRVTVQRAGPDWTARIDVLLISVWIMCSALLLIRILLQSRQMGLLRATWRRGRVDGSVVMIAPESGPGVVGTNNTSIVIPQWALSFDEQLRGLILRHEEEHRRAADPFVLQIARILTALIPWHAALAWQLHRLRTAVEIDCDARVLRAHPDTDRYARLLLAIAQLRSTTPRQAIPAMVEHISQLEERIVAMQTRREKRLMPAVAGSLAALLIVLAACSVKRPSSPDATVASARPASAPVTPISPPPAREVAVAPQSGGQQQAYFSYEVSSMARILVAATPAYPPILKQTNQNGRVLVQFVVDTAGRADMATFKIVQSTNPLFDIEVRKVLPDMRFAPAEMQGRKVPMYVQLPFEFATAGGTAPAAPGATGGRGGGGLPPGGRGAGTPPPGGRGSATPPGAPRFGTFPPASPATSATPQQAEVPLQRQPGTSPPPYFSFEVTTSARFLSGPPPVYPAILKQTKQDGKVIVQFVIDTTGRADMATYKVVEASNPLFEIEVRKVVPEMRFVPAEIMGRKVPMFAQFPFEFKLASD